MWQNEVSIRDEKWHLTSWKDLQGSKSQILLDCEYTAPSCPPKGMTFANAQYYLHLRWFVFITIQIQVLEILLDTEYS